MNDAANAAAPFSFLHCRHVGSSQGVEAAVGSTHATRQFASASHRRSSITQRPDSPALVAGLSFFHFRQSGLCRVPILG
ncbi:hypothetical protein VB145_15920 [Xanthomonas arboricola]|uniref:hypothetical protein n=1 Tax=Gammaproteobacteria TaxID=1236 RepID=UPI000B1ECBFC|nr:MULTISPECIES: hypothetical protein [Gammaproteobacteria]MEA5149879.1 hypothetical protein [Xanthomonas arboricola]UQP98379.1 hypothetical protein KP728_01200 [Xanthomonas arboricola pv. juglandis]UQQ04398.1 hypothetical protein KP727_11245 [Xanthomonas arboricola pv. juglandis]CAD7381699.1 hypothetical protein X12_002323 [Xanthomonas arboricola]